MRHAARAVLVVAAPLLAACAGSHDAGGVDARDARVELAAHDTSASEALPEASAPDVPAAAELATADTAPPRPDECAFPLRVPAMHEVPNLMADGTVPVRDKDTLCEVRYGALGALVYAQVTPTAMVPMWQFEYRLDGAFLCEAGEVRPVTARYVGGHHAIDDFVVELPPYELHFGVSHVGPDSFAHDPFDVVDVYEDATLAAEGLPVRCVWMADDGTVPPWR